MLASLLSFSQDKVINDNNAEKRIVSDFHAIHVSDGIDLYITQGAEEGLAVSASSSEYRNRIKAVVENGILKIWYENNTNIGFTWSWHNRRLKAYVSVKTIDEITAGGGSDVFANSGIKAGKLALSLHGGSDFSGKIYASDLVIEQNGGSDISISGTTVNLKVNANGGSDFKGFELVSENAVIDAHGGSDARLTVTKELAVEANGGSDIDYRGSPVVKHSSSRGGSSISRRQ